MPFLRALRFVPLLLLGAATAAAQSPPVAAVIPKVDTLHGDVLTDNYFWLRRRENPDVIAYLQAENAYTDSVMAGTKELQERLYQEILGRIQQTDLSVPVRRGPYFYYTRTVEGKQYPIYARKRGSLESAEEVYLDQNELAEGKSYLTLGVTTVSPDHRFLAFTVDTTGSEHFTLMVKDLATGAILPDRIPDVHFSVAWAADNRTLFYTKTDSAHRSDRVLRHIVGAPTASDSVIFHEPNVLFNVGVSRTKDDEYVMIGAGSFTSSEVWYVPARTPLLPFKVIERRRPDVLYSATHRDGRFYIRTNEGANNFKIVTAPAGNPAAANWRDYIAHSDTLLIDGLDVFRNHLVLYERAGGLKQIRIRDLRTNQEHRVAFPEPVYTYSGSGNPDFDSELLRFTYQSMVTPATVYDYHMGTRALDLKKRTEVLGGYDPSQYGTERTWARASDGKLVPVSLVYRKPLVKDGTRPLLLYAYGSYGSSTDPTFSSANLSLVDRGVVYAIAHIRGGQEMGRAWYDEGKMMNKMNTFTDFIAAAEHLVREGYTSSERLAIRGGSAGGLLMGAVVNMRPDLFKVVVADVPFVDVINTMLDASIPLTAQEWEQWGNPAVREHYDYMKRYSPYDNVERKAYPMMLVTTGLNDPRVAFWEPAKWVAKLRAMKTDQNPLLLRTNMGAGHGGSSGRYDALREVAFRYAFILRGLGLDQPQKLIPVEEFTLANGMKVIFHVDRSDPVVAVSLNAHVGSSREVPGRTGFAHLFEHLFFLESENLGKGGLDAMSARIGGSGANGSTSRDITDYLQTVPSDALEKMIWAEADKIGFFINTVTEPVLAKEKQVVKNEKRQSYDNRPYGHTSTVISENLYPAGHPYSWEVIGSLADLDAATLEDVKQFYRRWYVPNNVALVISGDFDTAQARRWVEKYFGEFPRGGDIPRLAPRPAGLSATKKLFHEDNFAQLPELTIAWPSVPALHPDSYALQMLFDLLTDGKETPLHAVLVDEQKLTSEVSTFGDHAKLAGESYLQVRGFEGVDLDRVLAALHQGFARFEREGIDPADLERAKTAREVRFYDQIGSVLGKASRIARYDLYAGTADFADTDVARIRGVTADDVMRVYRTYIKDRPFVATSFVPKGKVDLALEGSTRANVVEEAIVQGAEAAVDSIPAASYARTPSSFDRTVEPPFGPPPAVVVPTVWTATFANGLKAYGIRDEERPVAYFELAIEGGRLLDDINRPGAANLLAKMLLRGTARRTTAQLEDELKALGADVSIAVRDEHFVVSGRTLARNFERTMDLLEEILLEPRWDQEELALQKAAVISDIQSMKVQPNAIAARAFDVITFGEGHIYSRSPLGTESSVAALTMDDLKRFHAANLAPNIANFRVVGAVDRARVEAALQDLGARWERRNVSIPAVPAPAPPARSTVYFYDVPGAKQSIFTFGYPGPRRSEADFYPATAMNYILGGGGFASRFTQQLREGKGYTYGIRSGFFGGVRHGTFEISSGVRSNVTLEAAELVNSILADFGTTFTQADLEVTRSALTKGRARAFETSGAKLNYLASIADYGLPVDYPRIEQGVIDALTVEQVKALASRYVRPTAMTLIVVGDAATQAARLEALGFGGPVMINGLIERLDR